MKHLRGIIGICVVLVFVGCVVYAFWPNEVKAVRNCLVGLGEDVSKQVGEGNIASAGKMLSLGHRLCDKVTLEVRDVRVGPVLSSEELVSWTVHGRQLCKELDVRFVDAEIEIVSKTRAKARAAYHVKVCGPQDFDENRTMTLELEKIEGKWRLLSAKEDGMLQR